jgi:mRNA interferase RelE/StbE
MAQTYEIKYKKSVEKELRKLPHAPRQAVVRKILALAGNPRPAGSVKLRGSLDLYRVRHADYRVVYQVNDGRLIVLVIKIGHRREVYRDF